MLPDEPLDTALTDAILLSQLPLGRARGEGLDEPLSVSLAEPIVNLPLTGTAGRGPDTVSQSAALPLRPAGAAAPR